MGTELALRLIEPGGHELTVWNRTKDKTAHVAEAGAKVVDDPREAVQDADVVLTCLFGPSTVADVVLNSALLTPGTIWADITTISPDDARRQADWATANRIRFVHTPVIGTLGPARAGMLGVYVGSTDAEARELIGSVVAAYADPERLQLMESAPEAATAKLLANLALAVTAQGVSEAIGSAHLRGWGPSACSTCSIPQRSAGWRTSSVTSHWVGIPPPRSSPLTPSPRTCGSCCTHRLIHCPPPRQPSNH